MSDPVVTLPPDLVVVDDKVTVTAEGTWNFPRTIWRPIREKTKGKGVKVAVLDTGYYPHSSLPDPLVKKSYISGESVDDRNGHSTHCCGSICSNNEDVGAAPEADRMIYKVLSNSGSGSSSGIARAINDAVDDGADIISMSLGGGSAYQPTIDGIKRAFSRGVIVCIANGNSGFNGRDNTIGWPARSGEGVAVAALKENWTPASFSSGGSQTVIAAPGQNIRSCGISGQGSWAMMSGTSMATPHVAGYFALIVSLMRAQGRPSWTSIQAVNAWIRENATDLLTPGHDPATGFGMFDMLPIVLKAALDPITYL